MSEEKANRVPIVFDVPGLGFALIRDRISQPGPRLTPRNDLLTRESICGQCPTVRLFFPGYGPILERWLPCHIL